MHKTGHHSVLKLTEVIWKLWVLNNWSTLIILADNLNIIWLILLSYLQFNLIQVRINANMFIQGGCLPFITW